MLWLKAGGDYDLSVMREGRKKEPLNAVHYSKQCVEADADLDIFEGVLVSREVLATC